MIKRGFQRLMQQRFVLQCLLGLCIVSMVSNLNVSNHATSDQSPEEVPLSVSVELSATAQTAADEGNVANLDIDANDIDNYARAVLRIEEVRQSTLGTVQSIVGDADLSAIACHQEESLDNLPENAQQLIVTFCQDSIGFVTQNDLSVEQFNYMTNAQKSDEALKIAIQDALIRLQSTVVDEESVSSAE